MIEFPFIGGTEGDDIFLSPQRTVNLYPEVGQYKTRASLNGFPGDTLYAKLGKGPYRGGKTFKDHSIHVSGSSVFKVDKGSLVSSVGSLTTTSGLVEIAENGFELMIVDGVDGFVWNGTSLTKIIDTTFTQLNSDSVTYLDSAFWVNRPGTADVFGSDVLDATTWNAAKTARAEYKSDNVIKVWQDRQLFLGGTTTTQIYFNSGATPMPFDPLQQGRMIYGLASKDTVQVIDNTTHALFIDENGGVFAGKVNGSVVERISTRGLDRYWYTIDYTDAYSMAIQFAGHELYILTFPLADTQKGRTFAYEAQTKLWFEIGKYVPTIHDFGKYHARAHLFFDGKNLIGDENGDLWALDENSFTFQDTNEVISLRRAPVIHKNRERLFFNKLQLDVRVGEGTNSGQGFDPKLRLEISDNGGRSFKNFREKSIGKQGEYEQRVQFYQLGSSYDRVFQASISDPVPRQFMGAYLE